MKLGVVNSTKLKLIKFYIYGWTFSMVYHVYLHICEYRQILSIASRAKLIYQERYLFYKKVTYSINQPCILTTIKR